MTPRLHETILTTSFWVPKNLSLKYHFSFISPSQGNIILINTKSNKWSHITQIAPAPCQIQFGLNRDDEFLVAMPDSQLKCYNLKGMSRFSYNIFECEYKICESSEIS